MMKAVIPGLVTALLFVGGCAALQPKPYAPAPDGVSISRTADGNYSVDRIKVTEPGKTKQPEAVQFCLAQNLPGINGSPRLNTSKTRATSQGKDQVSFVVPRSMGTPLNYELMFSLTVSESEAVRTFDYSNLRIRGTWTSSEAPLPGTQDTSMYVDSALHKLQKISASIASCLDAEG